MSANNIVKFPEKNVFRQVPDEQVHQAMLNSIKVNVEHTSRFHPMVDALM